MENLIIYENKKLNLLNLIKEVKELSESLNIKISNQEKNNYEELKEDKFLLTVVGEFSRGKSMFINSLLGTDLLPSKIKPTTAMITSISHGENEEIILKYRDEFSADRLTLQEFQSMSAPREPDADDSEEVEQYLAEINKLQQIKLAEISIPNDLCKMGIQIIDTPGTNDIDIAREEITLSFVPKSDAVIVVLSATMPLTSDEIDFIKNRILSEHISKVFVILNRIDDIKNSIDRDKIIDYTYLKLNPLMPNVKVYPISAKDSLTIKMLEKGQTFKNKKQKFFTLQETGLEAFETDLSRFLQNEKGHVKLVRHAKKLNKSINELISNNLIVRVSALNSEIDDINKKINSLRPQIERYHQMTKDIIQDLQTGLKAEEEALFFEFEKEIKALFKKVSDSLNLYSGSLNDSNEVQKYLREQIKKEEEPLKKRLGELKKKVLDRHLQEAYKKLETEDRELNNKISSVFNVQVNSNNLNLNFEAFEEEMMLGGIALGAVGLGLIGVILAPFLLIFAAPLAFLGIRLGLISIPFIGAYIRVNKIGKIKKKLKKGFDSEFYTMHSNLKTEWDITLTEVNRIFNNEANKNIEKVEESLHQIRLESMKSKEERETIKQQLIQKQEQLQNIQQLLQSYIKEEVVL